jgi:hypothetical protein
VAGGNDLVPGGVPLVAVAADDHPVPISRLLRGGRTAAHGKAVNVLHHGGVARQMRLLPLPGLDSNGGTAILALTFTVLATAAVGLHATRLPAAVPTPPAAPAPVAAAAVKQLPGCPEPLSPDPDSRRRPGRPAANPTLVRVIDPTGAAVRGCVLSCSVVGLRLRVERPVPKGTVVWVEACHAPAGASPAEATVRSCRPMDVLYEVGCQFTSRPRPSILVLFG